MGSQVESTHGKAVARGPEWARWRAAGRLGEAVVADHAVLRLWADKPGGRTGSKTGWATQGSRVGK